MLRQLPPTITADETPDWLPAGWMVHSSFLKRGRQTKTYTQLTTGKKFHTKDHVLEYIKMEKLREKRESDIEKRKACVIAFQERIIAGKERPSWLPDDFEIEHKIGSYSGNPYTIYVHKPTGMSTTLKSDVLWLHNAMEEPQDSSVSGDEEEETVGDRVASRERPSWLPDDWEMEHRIGSYGGNQYTMYVNKSTGFKTHLKKQVLSLHNNTINQPQVSSSSSDSEEEEEATCNEIAYMIDESEEDFSETECFEKNVANFSTSIRSQPERRQKLDSRAKTQCVFQDEEMSSDNEEDELRNVQTSKEENAWGQARVAEEDQNLHDVVVECDDKAKGLTGTFVIEINVEDDEPANDGLVEKDFSKSKTVGVGTRNIEIINIDSDSDSDSSKVVEVKNKSEESLKAQSAAQEEIGDEARRSVPSESLPVNARSSADDNINKMNEPGLNQEENIGSTKKRKYKKKKSEEPCSSPPSKNIKKKKDIEEPIKKPKGKRPQREKGSPSVAMEEKRENIDWPKPNPNFVFEPITNRFRFLEDDSVIREYLEQNFRADSTLPLPDFGLPSFANLVISKDKEEEYESNKKKKSSLDPPPCVQVASSSLPSCSYMQHTVAGN